MIGKITEGDTLSQESNPRKYSPFPLKTFNNVRHIHLGEAYELVRSIPELDGKLEESVRNKDIIVYNFEGGEYLDRFDIGRVYHKEPEKKRGLAVEKFFSKGVDDIFESFGKYAPKDLCITKNNGEIIFEMKGAMFPESWTDEQAKMVAQKYFFRPNKQEWKDKIRAKIGVDYENSPKHMITRVSNYFADKGWELGYFETEADRDNFRDELMFLQAHRMGAFNSPAYFNAGIFNEYGIEGPPAISFIRDPKTGQVRQVDTGCYVYPVNHACFIRAAKDNLVSILEQVEDEGSIFSHGSGCGGDIGALREKGSHLSGGGKPSGPLSFMKVFDVAAGTIKSGGKSRRAARMQTMRYNHPDSSDFISAKVQEDKKALILMKNGFSLGMDGEAYSTVAFQNTNLSVRLDSKFFQAPEKNEKVDLISVNTGQVVGKLSAENFMKKLSFGAWRIGDPGVQYDDKIQEYHTCPHSGKINSSNPCGEYIFNDDTSCNLASTNLLAFTDLEGRFDTESYSRANRIMVIAQNIANESGAYPVADIARFSPEFSTIGLGFTNLGATLMRQGLAYDSDEGRAFTAAVSAIMTANAYETSAELAEHFGTFTYFELNERPMMNVIEKHKGNLEGILWDDIKDKEIKEKAYETWLKAERKGREFGYRNAQTTVLAPTGTTSFLLGCDTTGIECIYDLIIRKQLSGGGELVTINGEIPNALKNLGYGPKEIERIQKDLEERGNLFECPYIRPEHHNIFATARGDGFGNGAIPFNSHIKMVAAAQPFISGGISKTMNLPEQATVKEIYDGFLLGYQLGLKGLTVFRDNSKPISAMGDQKSFVELKRGEKNDLPDERLCKEFELTITNDSKPQSMHLIVSEYPDGSPGQISFLAYKGGQSLGTLLSISGISASKSLKRGVDLEEVVNPWLEHDFKPNGLVHGHKYIHSCKNALELAAKIILLEYRGRTEFAEDPDSVDVTKLRGFQNGAFRNYERSKIDSWDFNQVMEDPEFGGFVPQDPKKKLLIPKKRENSNLFPCSNCGQITLRRISSNCYECQCGHKIGGCTA